MRIWIDLANSPHPPLFQPIASRLEELGHHVQLTARDNAQTVEIARHHWPHVEVIGGHSPPGRAQKGATIASRVGALTKWVRRARPDMALSHNSYAQIVAARLAGIPTVTAMDYEHQPANHLAFRLAQRVLLPAPLARGLVSRQGASAKKVRHYQGLKEEIYLGSFKPDHRALESLGLDGESRPLVITRTPPSRAIYHRVENVTYPEALTACSDAGAHLVVLARHPEQRSVVEQLGLPRLTMPDHAVDAISLMYAADLVIGAGGTMTREAALLGVPTVSVFAGRPAAVDSWLESQGMLLRLQNAEQLRRLEVRPAPPRSHDLLAARGTQLARDFCRLALE